MFDRTETLTFQEAVVEVLRPGGAAAGFVSRVSVTARFDSLRLPVNIGARRRSVIATLGGPDHSNGDLLEYQEEVSYSNRSLDTVRLYFQGDRLAKIEWIYWLE